jgi:hypothetical protein
MKALKILSYVGKLAWFVAALDTMPFIDPKLGVVIFAAASDPNCAFFDDTAHDRCGGLVESVGLFAP